MDNINYSDIDINLRELVHEFDRLVFDLFDILYKNRNENMDININKDDEEIELLYDGIEITYFKNVVNDFVIKIFVSKKHFDDNMLLFINHSINDVNKQKLEIQEDLSSGGYVGSVCLNDLSTCLGKLPDNELEILKNRLEKMNLFIKEYMCKYKINIKSKIYLKK